MKLVTFVSTAVFIFFSAFIIKKNNTETQNLYNTKWSLKKIHTETCVQEVNTKAFIKFDAAKKSAGGNGSCNTFGSSFTITNNAISFKNIFSTKTYCEGVQQPEDTFFKQLGKANRYTINGKKLQLLNDKTVLLEFEAE